MAERLDINVWRLITIVLLVVTISIFIVAYGPIEGLKAVRASPWANLLGDVLMTGWILAIAAAVIANLRKDR